MHGDVPYFGLKMEGTDMKAADFCRPPVMRSIS